MPKSRTPRELLLAALDRRRLTGFRSSDEMAWVVFPPQQEGGASLEVIHVARANRFRVVSSETSEASTVPATTLGEFRTGDAAAECVEDALLVDDAGGHTNGRLTESASSATNRTTGGAAPSRS